MAFRNNQRFPAANQNNNMQQQIPGNIRFPGNGNNIQGALAQQQIMQNALQAMQGAVTMNQPWGSGIPNPAIANIANQQQNLALATITSMANQANPAVNMMGLLANQQLLAQAALVGNRGMGMQVPFTGAGAGILGAGPPIAGQLPQQMFPGASRNSYSPASTSSQHSNHSMKNARNARSASRDRGMPQNARNNSRDHSQSRDNSNKSGDQNRDRNRRNEKGDDRGKFRKDDPDGKRDRKQPDDRLKDSRKGDRGDDRRKDRSRDDKDDRRGPKRDERSGDGRRKDSRDRPRGSGDDRRSDRGDKRDRDRGERSRDSDRRRDRDSSPERKRRRGRDEDPLDTSEILQYQEEEIPAWTRCSPANLYFKWDSKTGCLTATKRMEDLEDRFEQQLVLRAEKVRDSRPKVEIPARPQKRHFHKHCHSAAGGNESSSSSGSESSDDDEENGDDWLDELNKKKQHPYRLHEELWYNDPGEMNDGPVCKCSIKSRKSGIRHNIYPGEKEIDMCTPESNNSDKLFHYRITMSPPTNFLTKCPSIIDHDSHEYIFEGYSLFSHCKLEKIPLCKVIRFNIEYSIHIIEEESLQNYTARSLDLFTRFMFDEILELVDLDWKGPGKAEHCNRYHLMPRFARSLPENGKEVLSMNEVLSYLLRSSRPLIEEEELVDIPNYDMEEWQNFVDEIRGMVVTYPGMKPASLRIDQLDRSHMTTTNEEGDQGESDYPLIIHFGIRPAQLSYAGDATYQKLWKQYVKFKHLLNSKPKVLYSDKVKLQQKIAALSEIRLKNTLKREVTVEISSKGFVRTGLKSDITQHTMLIPVLLDHIRFHNALDHLEETIGYQFQDRGLLQLALTHTSYKVKYGTNTDHARNSLSNCGMRQLEYGDRKIHTQHTRKRGINILINIMAKMGNKDEVLSEIPHNERLEFLGDAVVEFISSVHLFYMFPWIEEGGLTSYRTALVQNQHLAILAKILHLEEYMLYAHGPDLCHESDLKHAMANCFEALMGALFLDGGIEVVDKIYGNTLFGDSEVLLSTWRDLPLHPLQEDEPSGDRHWIQSSPALQKLVDFEKTTGIEFDHIRLLARAFTLRSVGYNNLTLGHNQRLEFLGDTVLQLIASEYLFRHFPDHHEGHLSLLRSSLVNNRTQSIVSDDLGMSDQIIHAETRGENVHSDMKTKEKADLLEAFMGALYVDKGLHYCRVFCHVCFFPRLQDFIKNQVWNDPKSQLQQCCLTLRDLDGGEPDIPIYKMIESIGPTNTRSYKVAVYFKGERLSTGKGHSIQQAEMAAACNALKERSELFPILAHQKRFLAKKYKELNEDMGSDEEPGTSFF